MLMLGNLDFVLVALVVLRILMLPLLVYNMCWSYTGFYSLMRGRDFPTSIYQSVIFSFCVGILGAQVMWLLGVQSSITPPGALLALCFFFLGNILAAFGRKYHSIMDFDKFYWLFHDDNLDMAVRAAKLNEFDPKFTRALIDNAEAQMAVEMVRRTMHKKEDT